MVGKVVCSYKRIELWNVCLDKELVSLKLQHVIEEFRTLICSVEKRKLHI